MLSRRGRCVVLCCVMLKVGGELGLSTNYGTSVSWELPRARDELRKSGSGYGDAGKGTRICERDDDLGGGAAIQQADRQ